MLEITDHHGDSAVFDVLEVKGKKYLQILMNYKNDTDQMRFESIDNYVSIPFDEGIEQLKQIINKIENEH